MQHLLEAVGAVHPGGLILLLVDARDGRQVQDATPAQGFPGSPQRHGQPHMLVGGQEIDGLVNPAQPQQNFVDQACIHIEQRKGHRVDQHPGDKVGQGGQHLHDLAVGFMVNFIEQHREQGCHAVEQQPKAGDAQGVDHHPGDFLNLEAVGENRLKPVQPHILAILQVKARTVQIKRVPPPSQGQIGKNEYQRQKRQKHQEQLILLRQ